MENIKDFLSAGGDAQTEFLYFLHRRDGLISGKDLTGIAIDYAPWIADAEERMDRCLGQLDMVNAVISAVPDPLYRTILTLRYIHRQDWKAIQKELSKQGMPYSLRSVYHLHDKALAAAEAVWKERHNDG